MGWILLKIKWRLRSPWIHLRKELLILHRRFGGLLSLRSSRQCRLLIQRCRLISYLFQDIIHFIIRHFRFRLLLRLLRHQMLICQLRRPNWRWPWRILSFLLRVGLPRILRYLQRRRKVQRIILLSVLGPW